MMNKVLLILLLTVFSHSAISAISCSSVFAFSKKMIARFKYPRLARFRKSGIEAYKGMSSYYLRSEMDFDGDMREAYFIVRDLLGEEKFKQLGWRLFNGTTNEFAVLNVNLALGSDYFKFKTINIKPDYIGQHGLKKLAHICEMNESKVYDRVSEMLEPADFAVLGWEKPLNLPASRAVPMRFS